MKKINFFLNKNIIFKSVNKSFTTQMKTKETLIHKENKPFFFKYQNIEYKADIPLTVDQTLKDFLDIFAKDRSITVKRNLSSKNFEAIRNGKYLPLNLHINNLNTKTNDIPNNSLLILDEELNMNNIRFRNMNHLRTPFESASQSLQSFLNGFIETININKDNLGTENMKNLLKDLGEIRQNKTKLIITIGSFIEKIKNISENKLSLNIKTCHHLDMREFNREDKNGLFLIENNNTGLNVPVNVVMYKNEDEKVNKFNEEIINNIDTLRKVSKKYNIKYNFGLVTDFYNWKINFYTKPEDDLVENPTNYLTSLKYNLQVSQNYVNENTYTILMKVLTGILSSEQEKLNLVKF